MSTTAKKTLVVSPTGDLGRRIAELLITRGHSVRGLVRGASREKCDALGQRGMEIADGDLTQPETLHAACAGCDTVISAATAMGRKGPLRRIDLDGQLALVAAAKSAGVRHFVFVSAAPLTNQNVPLSNFKAEVERAIEASGMTWTILQPTNFMDIWLGPFLGWDVEKRKAQVFGAGDAPISYIASDDVALFAALSIERAEARNRRLLLGGPKAISQNDALRMFETATSARFSVTRVPVPAMKMMKLVGGLFSDRVASIAGLGLATAGGTEIDMRPLMEEFGVELKSVERYVTDMAQPRVH